MNVAARMGLVVAGFSVAGAVLWRAFTGFDLGAVAGTIGDLTSAESLWLLAAFVVLLAAEAFLSASFVPGMPVRRGAIAWLASNAISSVIPGPSDLPMRYRMLRSWGLPPSSAVTAAAGSTLSNVAAKLVLPSLAAIALMVGDVEVGSIRDLVLAGCFAFVAVTVVVGFAFGTEPRTVAGAGLLARMIRRPALAPRIVAFRHSAVELIRRTWRKTLLGVVLSTAMMVVLFVACMRAVGVGSDMASWLALFSVWALVRGITVIPTMPGDAGVSELAFVSLLSEVAGGAGVNTITAGVLLYRALTWLAPIPLGVIAIAVWRWTLARHAEPVAD